MPDANQSLSNNSDADVTLDLGNADDVSAITAESEPIETGLRGAGVRSQTVVTVQIPDSTIDAIAVTTDPHDVRDTGSPFDSHAREDPRRASSDSDRDASDDHTQETEVAATESPATSPEPAADTTTDSGQTVDA